MRYQELGKTGIQRYLLSVMAAWGFPMPGGTPVEKEEAIRLIRRAYDFGYTLF